MHLDISTDHVSMCPFFLQVFITELLFHLQKTITAYHVSRKRYHVYPKIEHMFVFTIKMEIICFIKKWSMLVSSKYLYLNNVQKLNMHKKIDKYSKEGAHAAIIYDTVAITIQVLLLWCFFMHFYFILHDFLKSTLINLCSVIAAFISYHRFE